MVKYNNRIILLICLCIVLIIIIYISSRETFVSPTSVPEVCGTAGVRPSDATYHLLKSVFGNKDDFKAKRGYTPSECNKMDDSTYISGSCYQLKDTTKNSHGYDLSNSNIVYDYNNICGGLNSSGVVIPSPSECMIDGVHAGKASKPFKITKSDDKTINLEEHALRLYTSNECKLLKGEFKGLSEFVKGMGASDDEATKAEHINGDGVGVCSLDDIQLSFICTVNGKDEPSAQISGAAKGALKDWLST